MDLLGSAHGSGNGNLLHTAVRARPDSPAGGSSRGEEERTEFRMVAEGQGLAGQPFFGRCAEEGLVKTLWRTTLDSACARVQAGLSSWAHRATSRDLAGGARV